MWLLKSEIVQNLEINSLQNVSISSPKNFWNRYNAKTSEKI